MDLDLLSAELKRDILWRACKGLAHRLDDFRSRSNDRLVAHDVALRQARSHGHVKVVPCNAAR